MWKKLCYQEVALEIREPFFRAANVRRIDENSESGSCHHPKDLNKQDIKRMRMVLRNQ